MNRSTVIILNRSTASSILNSIDIQRRLRFLEGTSKEKEDMTNTNSPYTLFGVEFAPFWIPVERRLQVSLLVKKYHVIHYWCYVIIILL